MTINIREAKVKDLTALSFLWYELAQMHDEMMKGYDIVDNPRKKWVELMKKNMEEGYFKTFIAEEDEGVLGFVSVSLRRRAPIFKVRDIGTIMDVIVRKDRRNEGIGSELVDRAEKWIKEKGIDMAVLTVAPENYKGVRFWDKRGYETYLLKKMKDL